MKGLNHKKSKLKSLFNNRVYEAEALKYYDEDEEDSFFQKFMLSEVSFRPTVKKSRKKKLTRWEKPSLSLYHSAIQLRMIKKFFTPLKCCEVMAIMSRTYTQLLKSCMSKYLNLDEEVREFFGYENNHHSSQLIKAYLQDNLSSQFHNKYAQNKTTSKDGIDIISQNDCNLRIPLSVTKRLDEHEAQFLKKKCRKKSKFVKVLPDISNEFDKQFSLMRDNKLSVSAMHQHIFALLPQSPLMSRTVFYNEVIRKRG